MLSFSDDAALAEATAWAGRVTPVSATTTAGPWTLPDATTIPAPAALLIRPDGHVAWISDGATDLAGLRETLTTWCGAADRRSDEERIDPMNNKQEIPKSTDVLVVGAGPTGMTLAISLKQLGLQCVVIDQQPDPPDDARAAFVQPRTLEYLRRIQVAGPLIDDGLKGRGVAFADQDRDLIRLSYNTVDSPYPFQLMIPQSQTQRRLDQRFGELGGSVLRGVRVLDLMPEFPGRAATVVDSNGELRVINARSVAGCDGLRSRVRNQLGIGFPGSSPAQMFAVADVRFEDWPADRVEISFSLSPHGMLISSPMPKDMVRMVASVAPGTPAPSQQGVDDLIQTRGPSWMRKGKVLELLSSSTWRVHERVATQFRHGNTFLLGDAAHTHSPPADRE